jgi:hypothetical protein
MDYSTSDELTERVPKFLPLVPMEQSIFFGVDGPAVHTLFILCAMHPVEVFFEATMPK